MWMLKEARAAGLPFDEAKVQASHLFEDEPEAVRLATSTPYLQLDGQPIPQAAPPPQPQDFEHFARSYQHAATVSKVHDSLAFEGGLGLTAVLAWRVMEYLPFRRMDLQADGSWKPISWPLPRGETRDMVSRTHRREFEPEDLLTRHAAAA